MALSVAKWYDYRPNNQDVVGSNVASSWAIFLPLSFILMYYSVLNQGPQEGAFDVNVEKSMPILAACG